MVTLFFKTENRKRAEAGDVKEDDFHSDKLSSKYPREMYSLIFKRQKCGPRTERGSHELLQEKDPGCATKYSFSDIVSKMI